MAPSASTTSAVAAFFVHERDRDTSLLLIPRPEIQLIVRFGPLAQGGLDVYALGVQKRVRRKVIRAGQRSVIVRLHLGAHEAVLGVPAAAMAGRIVALAELWGDAATRRLLDRLGDAHTMVDAAAILESAIAERLTIVHGRRVHSPLALEAAERLTRANVNAVAAELGVSERHLRRVFRNAIGVSPKAFAQLARFHRALRVAREDGRANWASIAVATGYYDQSHLIDEFRAIAGVTPRALLGELGEGALDPARWTRTREATVALSAQRVGLQEA